MQRASSPFPSSLPASLPPGLRSLRSLAGILVAAALLLGGAALGGAAPAQAQSVTATVDSPTPSLIEPIVVDKDTSITVSASGTASGTTVDEMEVFLNGSSVKTQSGSSVDYTFSTSSPDRYVVEVVARGADGSTGRDTLSAVRVAANTEAPRPTGVEDGINENPADPTQVTLVLRAPNKDYVHVVGDFSDWKVLPKYQMNVERGTDSDFFWITIDGLEAGTEYRFQYLVDGKIRVADPYSEKVLSQNDSGISEDTYPDLIPYPTDRARQLVTVFETGETAFNFSSFDPPPQKDLIIYELLVRDFIEKHDYATLTDTLDYLDRLGVNAIELMPVSEFDGNQSWGYNPATYFAPDKYYGPERELKQFIEAAHQRGIAVILDVVYNQQTGQAPFVRLYNQDTFGPPTADNPWLNAQARHPFNVFYDNNHESPDTRYWLDRANEYWLTEFNVDGFRFDLSKGFTQGPDSDGYQDVGAWSSYDQERINTLQRMADRVWDVNPEAYVILEHFAVLSEERALTEYGIDDGRPGMMVWNNQNRPYSQSAMSYIDDPGFPSDFRGTYYKNYQGDGLNVPNTVSYMESHDEQWLMFRNREFGPTTDDGYDVTRLETALNRQKLVGAFFFTVPGARMMWQFGELGYGYGNNGEQCLREGGGEDSVCPESAPGRTAPKPIRWDYREDPARYNLYKTWAALIQLRKQNEVFTSTDTQVSFRTGQGVADRRIGMLHESMDAVIVGNFGTDTMEVRLNFPSTGTWHDFFPGEQIEITQADTTAIYEPGEFHVYTSEPTFTPDPGIVPYGPTSFRQPPRELTVRSARGVETGTRVRVTGTVTGRTSGTVYLQDGSGGIEASDTGLAEAVRTGDRVTVVGEVETSGARPVIRVVERFSVESNVGTPTPQSVTLGTLQDDPSTYDSRLVELQDLFIRSAGADAFEGGTTYSVTDGRTGARLAVPEGSGLAGESIPDGTASFSGVVTTTDTSVVLQGLSADAIEADEPAQFRFQVAPNPVTTAATVDLFLPDNGSLTIELYDALGRKVRTLVPEGAARSAGIYKLPLNTGTLSSGIYFLRLRYEVALEDARVVTKKIAVVK